MKKKRCGKCAGCTATECAQCKYCLDKPKYGGRGTLKKSCIKRECIAMVHSKFTHNSILFKVFLLCTSQVKQPELQSAVCTTETGTSSAIPGAEQSTADQQRIIDVCLPMGNYDLLLSLSSIWFNLLISICAKHRPFVLFISSGLSTKNRSSSFWNCFPSTSDSKTWWWAR